jgi:pilus assembly protein Flp/PilA
MTQLHVKALSAFSALLTPEEGQAMVEYALILALVSVAGIALLSAIGGSVGTVFSKVNHDFQL